MVFRKHYPLESETILKSGEFVSGVSVWTLIRFRCECSWFIHKATLSCFYSWPCYLTFTCNDLLVKNRKYKETVENYKNKLTFFLW